MTRTVADRITESAGRGAGRQLGALVAAAAAEEPPFLVAFVHGPDGVGESRLVRGLLDGPPRQRAGSDSTVAPTPAGLRRALGRTLGSRSPIRALPGGVRRAGPGLLARIWLTDDGFLGSALAHSVATNPHFSGLTGPAVQHDTGHRQQRVLDGRFVQERPGVPA